MNQSPSSKRYLYFTVFAGGLGTLAAEFVASRILQTVYGTSNLVWANVIGLVLFFLTMGYFLGGWLADRYPRYDLFYGLVSAAGFATAFFLLLSSALVKTTAEAMATVNANVIVGSFIGVMLALAVPITLLGCVSPFAIRLGVDDVARAGRVSGRIYAVSTWGSLGGTYLSVLFAIPTFGQRITAVIIGIFLLIVGIIGLWQHSRRYSGVGVALLLLLLPISFFWTQGALKAFDGQIYETESAYNYIQVVRYDDCNYLLLNEGQAFHSYYCDGGRVPQISVWSIMLAAPFYNAPEQIDVANPVGRVAVIGLAAGTIPKQYTAVFGPIPIDGIELDGEIVAVGRDYFGLTEPNINVLVGDGRYQLNQLEHQYDVITIDAYKVPYIPWHLTTQEFFAEVQAHLTADGVVAINVGRAPQDRRLIDAMTATLLEVYPSVHAIDVPGSLNTILIATNQPTAADNVALNLQQLGDGGDPLLRTVLETAVQNTVPTNPSDVIFTDQRAPVETIIDSLVIRYLLQEGASGLPGLQ